MFSDFEVYGGAVGLNACCLYGGAPYNPQQIQLKRGVDIVVGTPGRIKVCFVLHFCALHLIFMFANFAYSWILWSTQDHIERGNIDFRALKFRVLDESDEMLRMGFVEDVELILGMQCCIVLSP